MIVCLCLIRELTISAWAPYGLTSDHCRHFQLKGKTHAVIEIRVDPMSLDNTFYHDKPALILKIRICGHGWLKMLKDRLAWQNGGLFSSPKSRDWKANTCVYG